MHGRSSIEVSTEEGDILLCLAVVFEREATVSYLLSLRVAISRVDKNKMTPLHLAIYNDNTYNTRYHDISIISQQDHFTEDDYLVGSVNKYKVSD